MKQMECEFDDGEDRLLRVAAVVLTFRRERLATQVVKGLIEQEGFDPQQIIVVVNGEGGLDDPELEGAVQMHRLPSNLGPAGGFRAGLEVAATHAEVDWIYVCEDDIGLFELPTPRVAELVRLVDLEPVTRKIGGVIAYGRRVAPRSGRTVPVVPTDDEPRFPDVDCAAWGASLVRADVVRAGVLPDDDMFFGFEDFDFWFRMKRAGYSVVLDASTARAVAKRVFYEQREQQLSGERPVDAEEPWRKYYEARNFLILRRRYGRWTWTVSHIALTLRRAQLSPTWAHRRAAFRGLWDGLLRRSGMNPRYLRGAGERAG
jgi:hypothetical protein